MNDETKIYRAVYADDSSMVFISRPRDARAAARYYSGGSKIKSLRTISLKQTHYKDTAP